MAFNLKILLKIMELIQAQLNYEFVEWDENKHHRMDFLINAKKKIGLKAKPYTQVFENKSGFIDNLSILDVVFNLGPKSSNYLKNQKVIFP